MIRQYFPFKTGLIAHTVDSCGMQKSVEWVRQKLDGVVLMEGQTVPGFSIYLGYGLANRDGFAVIFHMLDDCITLSSYEYGDLLSVISNIGALTENGIVSDAYIMAMDNGDGRSSLAPRDLRLKGIVNGGLGELECELLSANPRSSMDDDSPAVKLSEFLMAADGDWINVSNKLIDSLLATVLDNCPAQSKVETAEAVIRIRKDLINSLRNIFL